jgi:hypothetical protein
MLEMKIGDEVMETRPRYPLQLPMQISTLLCGSRADAVKHIHLEVVHTNLKTLYKHAKAKTKRVHWDWTIGSRSTLPFVRHVAAGGDKEDPVDDNTLLRVAFPLYKSAKAETKTKTKTKTMSSEKLPRPPSQSRTCANSYSPSQGQFKAKAKAKANAKCRPDWRNRLNSTAPNIQSETLVTFLAADVSSWLPVCRRVARFQEAEEDGKNFTEVMTPWTVYWNLFAVKGGVFVGDKRSRAMMKGGLDGGGRVRKNTTTKAARNGNCTLARLLLANPTASQRWRMTDVSNLASPFGPEFDMDMDRQAVAAGAGLELCYYADGRTLSPLRSAMLACWDETFLPLFGPSPPSGSGSGSEGWHSVTSTWAANGWEEAGPCASVGTSWVTCIEMLWGFAS